MFLYVMKCSLIKIFHSLLCIVQIRKNFNNLCLCSICIQFRLSLKQQLFQIFSHFNNKNFNILSKLLKMKWSKWLRVWILFKSDQKIYIFLSELQVYLHLWEKYSSRKAIQSQWILQFILGFMEISNREFLLDMFMKTFLKAPS